MKLKQARLWIGQVIVPAAILVSTMVAANPELRYAINDKALTVKNSIKNWFKKVGA